MARTPGCDKSGLRKGTWTPEEDRKLTAYVKRYGCWNWRQIPKYAGLSRCGKSCRLRWLNYLKPDVKRGNFTREEDDLINKLHQSLGNRWSVIAGQLPGRTDNEIKNHWHTSLKSASKQASSESKPRSKKNAKRRMEKQYHYSANSTTPEVLESCHEFSWQPTSSSASFSELSASSSSPAASACPDVPESTDVLPGEYDDCMAETFGEYGGSFWTETFFTDDNEYTALNCPPSPLTTEALMLWSYDRFGDNVNGFTW